MLFSALSANSCSLSINRLPGLGHVYLVSEFQRRGDRNDPLPRLNFCFSTVWFEQRKKKVDVFDPNAVKVEQEEAEVKEIGFSYFSVSSSEAGGKFLTGCTGRAKLKITAEIAEHAERKIRITRTHCAPSPLTNNH